MKITDTELRKRLKYAKDMSPAIRAMLENYIDILDRNPNLNVEDPPSYEVAVRVLLTYLGDK